MTVAEIEKLDLRKPMPDYFQEALAKALDADAFANWLNNKMANESVGMMGISQHCPLARYLEDVFPGLNFLVNYQKIGVYRSDKIYEMWKFASPKWADAFICQVDHQSEKIVTAGIARLSLQTALRW